jgi:hypothetical protein
MSQYKRTTKKTGKYSKSTTTLNSSGRLTRSNSSKPPGSATRRTQSWNSETGKFRETHTTKMGGGWTRRTSRTLNPSPKSSRSSARSSKEDSAILLILFLAFFSLIKLVFVYTWKFIKFLYRIICRR